MVPSLPLLLTLYMFYLGLAAGLPRISLDCLSSGTDSEKSRRAVDTNERCSGLMSGGLTSEKYLECKQELENLVIDLVAAGEIELDSCVISKVPEDTAECPVTVLRTTHTISVTHPLLVSDIKSRFAPKGKGYVYSSNALVNDVQKKVKVTVHEH